MTLRNDIQEEVDKLFSIDGIEIYEMAYYGLHGFVLKDKFRMHIVSNDKQKSLFFLDYDGGGPLREAFIGYYKGQMQYRFPNGTVEYERFELNDRQQEIADSGAEGEDAIHQMTVYTVAYILAKWG